MESRLRSKKAKPRSDRPHDRQNQSIFGKVCSTVKGLLNPSRFFNVSNWISNSEEEQPESLSDDFHQESDSVREDLDIVSQSVSHGNKRLRLRLDAHDDRNVLSIQSSGTQTCPEQHPQHLYGSITRVSAQSSSNQTSLLGNRDTVAVLNGDDHSENSEGSASTSGCSSLVSSHKESNRIAESPFGGLLDIKNRKRKEPPKSELINLNSSPGLWSDSFSPSSKFRRRLPTVSHSNQPSFNLSTFVGPSKLNESPEKKFSSLHYEGKTRFGGASASRRMPSSVAPYQVEKNLRTQIRDREQSSEDDLKGMSNAAKRILLTLEKMSTPVADAKKIPNLNTSPVDLSVYLAPPKTQRNSQFTPSVASKGPPIVNISTIEKLSVLKNYGTSRTKNPVHNNSVTSLEQKPFNFDFLQPSSSETVSQKNDGGGKMRNKLNQHHLSSKRENTVDKDLDMPILKGIPLPISTLPTINFGSVIKKSVDQHKSTKNFTFSNPIEHDLSIANSVPASTLALPSPYDSFKFSNPIEHELPNPSALPQEKAPLPTWECDACYVRNPQSRSSCVACETSRSPNENKMKSSNPSVLSSFRSSETVASMFGNKPLEVVPTTLGSSSNLLFQRTSSSNQLQSSGAQNSSLFGTSFPSFIPVCEDEFSKPVMSTVSQTSSLVSASTKFSFKKNEKDSTPSQSLTPSLATSVFPKKSAPATTSVTTTIPSAAADTNVKIGNWECDSCWIKNPPEESKCMACETPRSMKSKNPVAVKSFGKSTTSTWECSSCWVRNPVKEKKCMACETPHPSADINTAVKVAGSSVPSTWECTSCWVKNPASEKKCMACETLHPSADVNPVLKQSSGFKFVSPLQNSAITFKFGNYVCTAPSNATTSLKFSGNTSESQTKTALSALQTTAAPSDLKLNAPTSINSLFSPVTTSSVSDAPEASTTVTYSTSSSVFTMPEVASSNLKTPNEQMPCSLTETSNSGGKFTSFTKTSDSVSEHSVAVSSNSVKDTTKEHLIKTKETSLENGKSNSATTNLLLNEKNSQSKQSGAVIPNLSSNIISEDKNVPSLSVTACFGFTTQPLQSLSKDTKSKNPAVFEFGSEPQKMSTFSNPTNIFKFGESIDSPQSKVSTTSVALTTATTTSFSFSSSCSNVGAVTDSKVKEITNTTSVTQPISISTVESKIPASTSISSVTTTSAFVFGSAVTTTTAPSAFSFFPSTSTSASAPSVFTFGSSSNMNQVSKSGGFTFKGLEKPQSVASVSSSTSQSATPSPNVGASMPVASGGFVFGTKIDTSNVTSVPLPFGSGSTTAAPNTSAFSAFQPSQPPNTNFQFGSQPSGSAPSTLGTSSFAFAKSEPQSQIPSVSQNSVSAFGSTSTNFVFGSKNEPSAQVPAAASQAPGLAFGSPASFTFSNKTDNANTASQNPNPTFGSSTVPSVFGSTTVPPAFDGSDKPANSGFSFGTATASSGVFQFGASNNTDKKRSATASGFSFGTPAASEANNSSFPTGFSMNTPPSFNFGAASTPTGPFQFAASTAAKPAATQNPAPRKYRKALRRVTRRD